MPARGTYDGSHELRHGAVPTMLGFVDVRRPPPLPLGTAGVSSPTWPTSGDLVREERQEFGVQAGGKLHEGEVVVVVAERVLEHLEGGGEGRAR